MLDDFVVLVIFMSLPQTSQCATEDTPPQRCRSCFSTPSTANGSTHVTLALQDV